MQIRNITAAMLFLSLAVQAQTPPQSSDPRGTAPAESVSDVPLVPGASSPAGDASGRNPYEGDEEAIREGKRLYDWYNCGGCHAPKGGGGMGPPLSDESWIYGDDGVSIYKSIWEGRPAGMPAWAGKLPPDDIWKLVAYLQALPADRPAWAPQEQ